MTAPLRVAVIGASRRSSYMYLPILRALRGEVELVGVWARTGESALRLGAEAGVPGYWSYDLHTRARGQDWWYPEYDAALGYPVGPAVMRPDGAWQRAFDAPGLVVVNLNDESVTVTVSRRHRCVSFGQTGTSFSVAARDGLILLEQG